GTLDLQSLGSVRIDRLAAADAGGSWLEATEVEIDWRPLALLSGRVTVDRVAARRIVVTRMPEPGETPTADGSGLSVPPITVAQVSFPAVVLGQPVLGAAAEVSVSGHLHLADPADSLTGALDISRIDGVAGAITSRFAYRP